MYEKDATTLLHGLAQDGYSLCTLTWTTKHSLSEAQTAELLAMQKAGLEAVVSPLSASFEPTLY